MLHENTTVFHESDSQFHTVNTVFHTAIPVSSTSIFRHGSVSTYHGSSSDFHIVSWNWYSIFSSDCELPWLSVTVPRTVIKINITSMLLRGSRKFFFRFTKFQKCLHMEAQCSIWHSGNLKCLHMEAQCSIWHSGNLKCLHMEAQCSIFFNNKKYGSWVFFSEFKLVFHESVTRIIDPPWKSEPLPRSCMEHYSHFHECYGTRSKFHGGSKLVCMRWNGFHFLEEYRRSSIEA